MTSPNDDLLKQCLMDAFAATIVSHDATSTKEEYVGTGNTFQMPFKTISKFIGRFWTNDFLDDMAVNVGSGVYVDPYFMLTFSRVFWMTLGSRAYFSESVSTEAAPRRHEYIQKDVIQMVATCIMLEKSTVSELSLLTIDSQHYHRPLMTLGDDFTHEKLLEFLTANNWLVPMYLLFTTGAYDAVENAALSLIPR